MLQYVRIKYENTRDVYVDESQNGETNTIIRVDEGTHKFDLGSPGNYTPSSVEKQVTGTTSIKPLEIEFKAIPEEDSP